MKTKKASQEKCNDKKCPVHGSLSLRGRTIVGTVISAKMQKTATIEWTRKVKLPKYERYTKKRTRVKAHNSDCIKAEEGDVVKIMECRPISKTVNFVIVEKMGKEKGFAQRKEALEESKKDKPKEHKATEEIKEENQDKSE